ncbi:hypothetical protein [Microbacterium marmarense]|uniref:Fis family transcriptional regulator n=1 Tax=Microbacterium marmarense TaxID=3122051 RepID=A0ABU8LW13_9MICO
MRWDRFFADLEDQLASEWEAERAALDTEAERLRLSRVALRDRLGVLASRERTTSALAFEMSDGSTLHAEVSGVGADWVALEPTQPLAGAVLAPLEGIVSVLVPHVDVLRSARPVAERSSLSDRVTFGFVLRDLVRRRVGVGVTLAVGGRHLTGTIDRAGADHFDLALHDSGQPRRTTDVTGHRLVPFAAVSWIRLDADAPLI